MRKFFGIVLILQGIVLQISSVKTEKVVEDSSQLFSVFLRNCGYKENDFILLTRALSNTLNFFNENLDNLVLDAGVGTRILERQIGIILDSSPNLARRVRILLKKLMERANGISESILNEIRLKSYGKGRAEKEKIEQTMPWVTSKFLWKTPQIGHWKHLEMDKISDYSVIPFDRFDNSTEVLDEDMSDCCIGELFSGCSISLPCQDAFLKEPHSKYSLTHQVIYLHIAEQICKGKSDNSPFPDWKEYSETLCSRVFQEAKAIADQEYPAQLLDLYGEQMVVCSLAGYKDFLSPEWMYRLLVGQQGIGKHKACFLDHEGKTENKAKRQRRSENIVDYQHTKCSVHFSAVGLAGLAIHLRHFLEICIP